MTTKGTPKSEEHKRKISESLRGRPGPMCGRQHSLKSIEKMSESHKGQSSPMLGMKHTPEALT